MHDSHIPDEGYALPQDYYRGFDKKLAPDGGLHYTLPLTLLASASRIASRARVVAGQAATALLIPQTLVAPPPPLFGAENLFAALALMISLHLSLVVTGIILLGLTNVREKRTITLRQDGLILDDKRFYPKEHIRAYSYGHNFRVGGENTDFRPIFEIKLGVRRIKLASGLRRDAAQIFGEDFSQDVRRYWFHIN